MRQGLYQRKPRYGSANLASRPIQPCRTRWEPSCGRWAPPRTADEGVLCRNESTSPSNWPGFSRSVPDLFVATPRRPGAPLRPWSAGPRSLRAISDRAAGRAPSRSRRHRIGRWPGTTGATRRAALDYAAKDSSLTSASSSCTTSVRGCSPRTLPIAHEDVLVFRALTPKHAARSATASRARSRRKST
jgi:hypothetical protein